MFEAADSPNLVPFDGSFRVAGSPTRPPEHTPDEDALEDQLDDLVDRMYDRSACWTAGSGVDAAAEAER